MSIFKLATELIWISKETEVKVDSPTFGSDNTELGSEALTQLVREVLEEVFEARVKEMGEMLQTRCLTVRRREITIL
ncbi:hypothetical protein J1N35_007348 [Gossypium stocksii]|uniref:Uncharacterized protein n=1 Tax=Gossypium stocksii TaxID=47602 RepID=A0A9D4AFI3_9ROSI|nr:hypothetical protein J1N35_007348 [Gossypium stocksii]